MKRKIWSTLIIIIIIIYLLIPLVATATYSMFQKWTDIVPEGFTLKHYGDLLSNQAFMRSLGRTILVCIIPILITVAITLLALFVVTVYFPKLEKYIQILCMIPYTIQGVILSVSILSLICRCQKFLRHPPGDVVWCLLHHHLALYLPGNPQQHAFDQYAHVDRGCRNVGIQQVGSLYPHHRSQHPIWHHCFLAIGSGDHFR
jgi:ABC-type spermidine/putrescine transport system permease subunit II